MTPRQEYVFRTKIAATAQQVFDFHKRDDAFELLTPPWAHVKTIRHSGGIQDGVQRELEVKFGPFKRRWLLEHRGYIEGRQFGDVQLEGPFASWEHTHRVIAEDDGTSVMEDRVVFALPAGVVGKLLGGGLVRRELDKLFEYGHRVTRQHVEQSGRLR